MHAYSEFLKNSLAMRKIGQKIRICILSNHNIALTNKHFFNYFNYHCVYVNCMIIQSTEKLVGNLYTKHVNSSIACTKCDGNSEVARKPFTRCFNNHFHIIVSAYYYIAN